MLRIGLIALAIGAVACSGTDLTLPEEPRAPTTVPPTTASTASEHSTTTRAPADTSTAGASIPERTDGIPEVVRCRTDPFTAGMAANLAREHRGKEITAHVYDARTGCHYSLNPDNRQLTASVFKVLVMSGTLLEAQMDDRDLTDREVDLLKAMITESANTPVRALWRSFGASPWFRFQAEAFGLDETRTVGDGGESWGGTRSSAKDQVDLLRQVLLGEWGPLEKDYRSEAIDLMTSVLPEQAWGVTAGVPDTWDVAQKNGFAGSIINSVGWVDEPGESPGYVVAILTRGWPSHSRGIEAVEQINLLISDAMIDRRRNLE